MRLYHSTLIIIGLAFLLLSACAAPPATQAQVVAQIIADGQVFRVRMLPGTTVQEALDALELSLGSLDRVEPPDFTVLANETEVIVTRVREEFEVEQVVIPYEKQLQPSEFLSVDETQPLQLGDSGLQEITYRRVFEDGVEVSKTPIKSVIVKEAVAQIMLVGVQTSHTPLPIPGRLVYLSDGNAWMLEVTTANRSPVVSTGDLDGRVFSLSGDGEWLLFTRRAEAGDVINTLWAVQVGNPEFEIDMQVENVVHFADWEPGSDSRIAFSTVESRQAAPGWQANNDLSLRNFSINGWMARPEVVVETNSGGVYGWWGTDFVYAPDYLRLAYAGPDRVGVLDLALETQTTVLEITPLQTRSDWAWVPGVQWGPDGKVLYTVNHAPPPGAVLPEESPIFDLTAIPLEMGSPVALVLQVGMFAYPLPSPLQPHPSGENAYQVAYLQAIFPTQSDTSRYRLMVMDRDGSNQRELFPPSEALGIEPQREWGVWSPEPLGGSGNYTLAILYQGNIWLVDAATGEAWQVTGDGRINRVDWR
ncbi:MAG: G5 domain-containing protein [Chloroflexota bacterium]